MRETGWFVQSSDRVLFEVVCQMAAQWEAAREHGPCRRDRHGALVEHPATQREAGLRRDLVQGLAKMGMTPADVRRLADRREAGRARERPGTVMMMDGLGASPAPLRRGRGHRLVFLLARGEALAAPLAEGTHAPPVVHSCGKPPGRRTALTGRAVTGGRCAPPRRCRRAG